MKETLALPKEVIDERFDVRGRDGVDIEIVGGTGGGQRRRVPLHQPRHARRRRRAQAARRWPPSSAGPEEIIAALKAHPAIAPLVEGGEVKEYSAHLIPEAGLAMMPQMTGDGMLVAGDAAALCLAAGIWLEGVNFAMASGIAAGEAADRGARRRRHVAAPGWPATSAGWRRRSCCATTASCAGRPELVLSDRVQHLYPQLVASTVEAMFRVDNPHPKPGLRRILDRRAQAPRHPPARPRCATASTGWRTFG